MSRFPSQVKKTNRNIDLMHQITIYALQRVNIYRHTSTLCTRIIVTHSVAYKSNESSLRTPTTTLGKQQVSPFVPNSSFAINLYTPAWYLCYKVLHLSINIGMYCCNRSRHVFGSPYYTCTLQLNLNACVCIDLLWCCGCRGELPSQRTTEP